MKRARISKPTPSFTFNDGDMISIRSFNFPDHRWGWKDGDIHLSIVRSKKNQRVFRINGSQPSKSFCLGLVGSSDGSYIGVDEDSAHAEMCGYKTHFLPEVMDDLGSSVVVRFATKDKRYLRHSNYILRADEPSDSDKPFSEDSRWILDRIDPDSVSTAPSSPNSGPSPLVSNKPLFIHIQQCFKDTSEACGALVTMSSFISNLQQLSVEKPRVSNIFSSPNKIISYSRQGAGGMGMEAGACAISMHRSGEPVTGELKRRIEEATTVKSRGGIASFTHPSKEVEVIVNKLAHMALSKIKRSKMFGMHSRRNFDLELGFCEWVVLPHGKEIVPHRDGGNDCDVAAIFACSNASDVSVEEASFTLDEGGMYIFEPQKYLHSVSKPHHEGPRTIVALRFFRVYDP